MSCGGCCPDRPIATDEVCQNWEFRCDSTDRTIWEADGDVIKPFGTVTVLVENSCDGVEVYVNDTLIATLTEGQSFSKTFNSLKKVSITCLKPDGSTGSICCGKLCMTVHYKKC
ncbi:MULTISPECIES: DUF3992 domain-containing protein [Anoxybacillus]|uniref:Uncharacterized protein n=1 Tax=Anoxybacillus flavithermus TaxID=33934 RepID=A0A178TNN5_9BACL|nr:S-Ena type endospore appendage [Anoxybacillus flavithermus]ASA95843.1 DUF3992 domain-containing protein [Anoxybacillus flavithermus]ELK22070.1 hypothetical protein AF6_1281 [Anoxybacillus flavithermus TNO-09.006]MBE2905663.1 DUF3992 domain-containing protein [Anoxybacillus flavithermus]MBE2908543.1 DUF3992 domain-containing protein [Anoxybacillus flavithermus]MBE2911245.1 DUF3992 domain-containing protein [Anoxybacillus flavithermus]